MTTSLSVSQIENAPATQAAGELSPPAAVPLTLLKPKDLAPAASAPITTTVEKAIATLNRAITLVVPAGATIRGDIEAESVLIYGAVHGRVASGTGPMILAEGSEVQGTVEAQGDVLAAGRIDAPDGVAIKATGKLTLTEKADIAGEVQYRTIAVYEGATIEGNIKPLKS